MPLSGRATVKLVVCRMTEEQHEALRRLAFESVTHHAWCYWSLVFLGMPGRHAHEEPRSLGRLRT